MTSAASTVVLTDRAWPDAGIERAIVEAAGLRLVDAVQDHAGMSVQAVVEEHHPAAVMTCWSAVSARTIRTSPALKIVTRLGIGLDNIDVGAATARGVWVSNVPDYCIEEVSDHALALVLDWTRQISRLNAAVKGGRWDPSSATLRRLATLTVGLVGHGRIGRRLAEKLTVFACPILVHVRGARAPEPHVEFVPLNDLLERSDIVVLVAPLNEGTRGMINAERLARMRRGALLVNVSRGQLVDSDALMQALAAGHLGAAALDVLDGEPAVPDALRGHASVTITPHVAFASNASVGELRRRAAEDVVRTLRGQLPLHACNEPQRA